jgi:hypothetical protein
MLVTQISMEDGVVLIRGRKNILDTEGPVPKSDMLSCRSFTSAPTASYLVMDMHKRLLKKKVNTLTRPEARNKGNPETQKKRPLLSRPESG